MQTHFSMFFAGSLIKFSYFQNPKGKFPIKKLNLSKKNLISRSEFNSLALELIELKPRISMYFLLMSLSFR